MQCIGGELTWHAKRLLQTIKKQRKYQQGCQRTSRGSVTSSRHERPPVYTPAFAARRSHVLRKPHLLRRKASQRSPFCSCVFRRLFPPLPCGPVPAPWVLSLLLCFLHKRVYRRSFPLRLLFGFFSFPFQRHFSLGFSPPVISVSRLVLTPSFRLKSVSILWKYTHAFFELFKMLTQYFLIPWLVILSDFSIVTITMGLVVCGECVLSWFIMFLHLH